MQRLGNPVSLFRTFLLLPVILGLAVPVAPLRAQTSSAIAALRPVPQANRVPANANLAPQASLTGHLPAWVAGQNLSSRLVDLQAPMQVTVSLRRDPAVQSAFEALLAAQQNPASPLFHQWLTPQQLGTLYGPTQSDLDAVTAWAAAQGLKIETVATNRMTVRLSGTTAAIASAFRTSFSYYTLNSKQRLAANTEPSVPAALAPVFLGVDGLVDLPIEPQSHFTVGKGTMQSAKQAGSTDPAPLLNSTSGAHYVVPADLATIYDINPVYTAGNTGATVGGKTQHIAVIGRSNVAAADIANFASTTGIATYHVTEVVAAGPDPGTTGTGDQIEATLDVNRTTSTANGAYTDLVVASNTYGGITAAANYNVNTLVDPVMTISFGACESLAGPVYTAQWDSIFSAGAAVGISSFVSSGDSAAAGCATAGSAATTTNPVASVNYICSSSYVTCVGGTEFNDSTNGSTYWAPTNTAGTLGSALSYIPEGVWNEPTSTTGNVILGGGGGFSQYITKPSWQTGTGVPADGHRDQPDVSFTSAGHDGYYICYVAASILCTNGSFGVVSGTSAAAPEMAGIAALLNTRAGVAQGNLNPLIYRLAASVPKAFHDATVASSGVSGCTVLSASICNNSTPSVSSLAGGLAGYAVGTGYDQATGWGSLDVNYFLAAAAPAATTLSLSASPTQGSATQAFTFTATLTPGSTSVASPTGTVQFYANGVALGSPITLSGTTAVTPASTLSAFGLVSITAVYSGDTYYQASTAAAVVVTVAGFSISPTSPSISFTSGATTGNTDTVTVTSLTTFAGAVSLTCGIVGSSPAFPPTCTVAPTSVTLAAKGTGTAVVTIGSTVAQASLDPASRPHFPGRELGAGGAVLVAMLLGFLPNGRRRRARRVIGSLTLALLLAFGLGAVSGCSSSSGNGTNTGPPALRSSAGSYTVTVTATSGTQTATTTFTVAIN
jgi:subtilase family serine protease